MIQNRSIAFSTVALATVLSASLAHGEPRRPTHVACVGDSITAGAGATSPAANYPSRLQALFGDAVVVKNFGHSGATLLSPGHGDVPYVNQSEYQAATDFVDNAPQDAIVDVVIMLGANDSKPFNWNADGAPKNDQQFAVDYAALVDHFTGLRSKPTVFLALPLATTDMPCCAIRGEVIHEELPLIRQVAAEKGMPIIDVNTPTTEAPEYFTDGVHPNDAGYVVVAQVIYDGLLRVPAVRLVTPASGESFALGSAISLSASDREDPVAFASAEFFDGTTSLGTVATEPFSLSFQPKEAKTYALSVKVVDATGASATSAAVSVTVTEGQVSSGSGSGGAAGSGGSGGVGGSRPLPDDTSSDGGCSVRAATGPGTTDGLAVIAALALVWRRAQGASRRARTARKHGG